MASVPDSLRSKDTIEAILGLCEGPIFGLEDATNPRKSFYVGDTPLQNQNGTDNFSTFDLTIYPGDEDADEITPVLSAGTSNNHVVNVDLETDVPVVRSTVTQEVDQLEIRILITRLVHSKSSGAKPTSVTFRIEYKQSSSGTWIKAYGQDITISGKTMSTYAKDFKIPVPRVADTYDIRVTKISPANTADIFRDVQWESYQSVIMGPRAYDNTAVAHVVFQATDQVSSLPQLSGIYKGRLIKVPSNYDPITRIYTGAWDGSWQIAWTDNPAWVLYDFVMNERFGIKAYYPEINLNRFDVYEAAEWCDEMVDDGEEGLQPRYTFNALISEARPGPEMARYFAGSFNATFLDDLNGTAFLRVDKDDQAVQMFTQENIIGGDFEYSYTDITTRYNDITVTFVNPELNWAEDRRRVSLPEKIALYGRIPLDFIAVGCLDPHEAVRRAWYKLITANTETRLVKFQTNRIGQFLQPFDVILISDPDMGYGISGRISSIDDDRTTIYLRDPIFIEAGVTYTIVFTLNNGEEFESELTYLTAGEVTEITFNDAVPEDVLPDNAVFRLEQTDMIGAPRPFRIMKIEEVDGNPDQISIQAININRNKWYDSDNVVNNGEIEYSVLPNPFNVPGPDTCTFEEDFVVDLREFQITVSPYFNRRAYPYYDLEQSFEVWSRLNGSGDPYELQTLRHGDTLINHPPGLYDFKILGISTAGTKTALEDAPVYQFEVTNPLTPPADIDWIRQNKREIYWGYDNPPDDFAGFEVRYHNIENKITWDDALTPHAGLLSATQFYTNLIPPSARVVMVKAVDAFGIYSDNAAVVYRPAPFTAVATNLVDLFEFHNTSPPWQGEKIGCSIDIDGFLKADPTGAFYSGIPTAPIYTGDPDAPMYEAVYEEFIYIGNFNVTHAGDLLVNATYEASGYEVSLREATSPPGPWFLAADTPSIEVGSYDIKIRIFGGPVRGILEELTVIVDAVDQYEILQNIAIADTGTRLPITKTYSEIRLVEAQVFDDGVSDAKYAVVFDKQNVVGDGPLVKVYDETGTLVSGTVDAIVRGYV